MAQTLEIIHFVSGKPMYVESFFDFSTSGIFFVVLLLIVRQTVAVGVIRAVDKAAAEANKVTRSA